MRHFKSILYRQRGMHPADDQGESSASPLWKPHRLCARRKRRGIKIKLANSTFQVFDKTF